MDKPMKTGLDDGPLLPSPQQLEKAYRKIERESRTDVQRINWMESRKYLKIGIGFDGPPIHFGRGDQRPRAIPGTQSPRRY